MSRAEFDDLAEVTEALYQAELARVQDILRDETRLRQDLARLSAHHQANRALPQADLDGLRRIGADVLWHGWVGRNRVRLQEELARVLVRKAGALRKLRAGFGKAEAVRQLRAETREADTRARLAHESAILTRLALLRDRSGSG
ncbi:hypothetical protein RA2_03476 [Roseovarius sp. A-2]|uniref:hypothetical protein n=1 Tax=Roseovarius sp. A-2 TaxID=1570360 RepID=UPI0009B57F5F|nr:hypothetical protein [Roseovarius sp. A-2]GAW36406.1 hypothetical protein RA2_03476 [Roseovarius sp. A-2]